MWCSVHSRCVAHTQYSLKLMSPFCCLSHAFCLLALSFLSSHPLPHAVAFWMAWALWRHRCPLPANKTCKTSFTFRTVCLNIFSLFSLIFFSTVQILRKSSQWSAQCGQIISIWIVLLLILWVTYTVYFFEFWSVVILRETVLCSRFLTFISLNMLNISSLTCIARWSVSTFTRNNN